MRMGRRDLGIRHSIGREEDTIWRGRGHLGWLVVNCTISERVEFFVERDTMVMDGL